MYKMDRNVYEILHILCQNNGLKMKNIYIATSYTYTSFITIFSMFMQMECCFISDMLVAISIKRDKLKFQNILSFFV